MVSFNLFYTRNSSDSAAPQTEGVAVTGSNTYYSDVVTGKDADGASVQLEWSGTPSGTFTLWCSDKVNPILTTDADWYQDTTFAPTNPAGSASKMGDDFGNSKAKLKRVKYVNASGSGTLKGWVTVNAA